MAWKKVNSELYQNDKGFLLKKFGENDWRFLDNDNYEIQIPVIDLFNNPILSFTGSGQGSSNNTTAISITHELVDAQNSVPLVYNNFSNYVLFLDGIKLSEESYTIDKNNNLIHLRFSGSDGSKIFVLFI